MKTSILPGTTQRVSRLGFGTASLHHRILWRDRKALLSAALDLGFSHFDTARMYGEGLAERDLGRFLGSERKKVTIATKFGMPAIKVHERLPPLMYMQRALGKVRNMPTVRDRCLDKQCLEDSLRKSLQALRTDWIDVLFLHEPCGADHEALKTLLPLLMEKKSSGVIRYLGLAGAVDQCLAAAIAFDDVFDIMQVEDTLDGREADRLLHAGRRMQITFGYIRRRQGTDNPLSSPPEIIAKALERNAKGMVLVSSRKADHLSALAEIAS